MKEPLFYIIMRPFLYLFLIIKFKPTFINKDVIPKKGRCILAGNHTNNYDCILLGGATKRPIRYLAKKELCSGIKGFFIKLMGIVPVDRSIHDKSVIPTSVNLLKNEQILGIFPEGTINRTKDIIMPFKKGAVVMAIETGAPIIPFAINGNYKRGKAKIILGEMYYPKSRDTEKEIEILEDKVIELIKRVSD